MNYMVQIYPTQEDKLPIPKVGDLFIVVEIIENCTDFHWGKCKAIELIPADEKSILDSASRIIVSKFLGE